MFVIRSRDWIPMSAVTTARHRNSTYGTLNLILLISRDAIHFWLFAGTLIGLLPSYNQLIRTRRLTRVNI